MDLATPDNDYRKKSIIETQKVVDITRSLKKFFPKTKKPLIVVISLLFTNDIVVAEASVLVKGTVLPTLCSYSFTQALPL